MKRTYYLLYSSEHHGYLKSFSKSPNSKVGPSYSSNKSKAKKFFSKNSIPKCYGNRIIEVEK